MNDGCEGLDRWTDPESDRDAEPHGFRSSFSCWANETGVARPAIEAALAHQESERGQTRVYASGISGRTPCARDRLERLRRRRGGAEQRDREGFPAAVDRGITISLRLAAA